MVAAVLNGLATRGSTELDMILGEHGQEGFVEEKYWGSAKKNDMASRGPIVVVRRCWEWMKGARREWTRHEASLEQHGFFVQAPREFRRSVALEIVFPPEVRERE